MHFGPAEHRAVSRTDPFDAVHRVPEGLRGIDSDLQQWGRWCQGRPAYHESPMFRLFRASHARAYGAPTISPPVDGKLAQAIEKQMRNVPRADAQLLKGWYVLGAHPMRLCRYLAIAPRDLPDRLNRSRIEVRNLMNRADAEAGRTRLDDGGVFA